MSRQFTVEEELRLYSDYYRETDVGKREVRFDALHAFLAGQLRLRTTEQNKKGAEKDEGLVEETFLPRQLEILRRLAEESSGDWREDLKAADRDDLAFLCSSVGDEILHAELTQILRRSLRACRQDLALAYDAIYAVLLKPGGRRGMMDAILTPQGSRPVCAGYCIRTARNAQHGECKKEQLAQKPETQRRLAEESETRQVRSAFEDGRAMTNGSASGGLGPEKVGENGPGTGARLLWLELLGVCGAGQSQAFHTAWTEWVAESQGASSNGLGTLRARLLAASAEAQSNGIHALRASKSASRRPNPRPRERDDLAGVLAEVLTLPAGAPSKLIALVLGRLPDRYQQVLWLSRPFQMAGAEDALEGIASPIPGVRAGEGLAGEEAATRLGMSRENFHRLVHAAKAAFVRASRDVLEKLREAHSEKVQEKGVGQ